MAKAKKNTPSNDLDNIRQDLDSLKSNVVNLARDLKRSGRSSTESMVSTLSDQLSRAREASNDKYVQVEKSVSKNPAKSIAMAFGAGILASFLFSQSRKR